MKVKSSNIGKDFIIELSHIGVVVQSIFEKFFPLDLLEKYAHCESTSLVPMLASVSPKVGG